MWHSEWGLLLCTAGIARNLWGVTKDTEQTDPVIYSTILPYTTTGAITFTTHAQTQ